MILEVMEMIDKWDADFTEVGRLDDLGFNDATRAAALLEGVTAPAGHEVIVMAGIGGAPYLASLGCDFETTWFEAAGDAEDDSQADIVIRVGYAPLGWLDSLGEFDGF